MRRVRGCPERLKDAHGLFAGFRLSSLDEHFKVSDCFILIFCSNPILYPRQPFIPQTRLLSPQAVREFRIKSIAKYASAVLGHL